MWEQNTNLHESLVRLVREALNSSNEQQLSQILFLEQKFRQFPAADSFAAALDKRVESKLFPVNKGQTFSKWIEGINNWLDKVQDPRREPSIESSILYVLWDRFASDLCDNLRRARIGAAIPSDGYVLAFVNALSRCIVVHYTFAGLLPKLDPKVVIDNPKSAFDIWDAIDVADQSSKNYLKRVLTSGHKLISHRGILVHVDRRSEHRVFGPSIDTVLMSEVLGRRFYEQFSTETLELADSPRNVLEIGTGSGFLSAGAVRYLPNIEKLLCIDLETSAILCTKKNIDVSLLSPGTNRPIITYSIAECEMNRLSDQHFDLIICNPPYIPFPPDPGKSSSQGYYLEAVGGLNLIEEILRGLPKILSPTGSLLLMVNNLSLEETLKMIPEGYETIRPLADEGYEVLFDVEVVIENQHWLSYLQNKDNGQLYSNKGVFYHRLHPLWVSRQENDKGV